MRKSKLGELGAAGGCAAGGEREVHFADRSFFSASRSFFPATRYPKSGFTLIELLLVTGLLAFVGLVLAGLLSSGIRIWQRASENAPAERAAIFCETFTADIRNTVRSSATPFLGAEDSFELSTLVTSHRMGLRTIGKVRYIFKSGKGTLIREEFDIAAVYSGNGTERVVLDGVAALKLRYYYFDKGKGEYVWLEEAKDLGEPFAIRAEVTLTNGNGTGDFTKTVSIPVSN